MFSHLKLVRLRLDSNSLISSLQFISVIQEDIMTLQPNLGNIKKIGETLLKREELNIKNFFKQIMRIKLENSLISIEFNCQFFYPR